MHHFAFILDQQVGLRTQALNFERAVTEDSAIAPVWIPVRYETPAGFLSRLPGVPKSIRGTLRGVREIQDGWRKAENMDAALWATWAAKSVPELVRAAPAFFVMDMTPTQMEAMGELYGYTKKRAQFLGAQKRRATERIYQTARHFFPWNAWVGASLQSDWNVPAEKITPVSPGVDVELYQPDPSAKADDGVTRLLFVGGDFARKGGDLLLRWANARQTNRRWEMHIVTRDDVPDTPGVHVHRNLPNNSPELVRLYQASDVFVLPTRADCYSLVAMEAMACGLPVVISRLGGIPEIVADGQTGYLLDADDFDALAGRLDALVADPALRQKMGKAGHCRAVARFDSRVNVGRILDAMKEAARP